MRQFYIILGLCFITLTGFSQRHDIKLQLTGLPFGNYGGGYEYVFGESFGAVANVNFSNKVPFFLEIEDEGGVNLGVDYSDFSFTPEIRYYIDTDYDGDGSFLGFYLRFKTIDYKPERLYSTYNYDSGTDIFVDGSHNASQTFIGFTYGYKSVKDSGLVLETSLGIGYAANNTIEYDDINAERLNDLDIYSESEAPFYHTGLDNIDFRFSFSVGWRFNKE